MQNQINLKGQVAIITGGAQGIGFAIAKRLAASGARVALWDRDATEMARAKDAISAEISGAVVIGQKTDVTDFASVEAASRATIEALGQIDIMVNNAGIAGMNKPLADYPLEEWRRVLDIDLNGVFYCCKAVVPHMVSRNYGRIVNIASIAGKEGNPNAVAYSAAKAGVIALTKSLGKELADKNIAVNCVTPAAARTAIFDQMSEQQIAYMLSKIPRGRFVQVDEIASMVSWMVSSENSFTTGGVFDISGGRATY